MSFKNSMLNHLLAYNPQFFREIKGRVKTRNVIIASVVSLFTQLAIVLFYLGQLPNIHLGAGQYSHYCFGVLYNQDGIVGRDLCETDLLGNWLINWQLFWLDIFLCLSIVSMLALLVVGSYMLIADLTKEENQGTLNFIRLTPQSATNILLGKILGVPIMLYGIILWTLPLNLFTGLNAHIPISLILSFYAVIIASCAFFYSAAIVLSLLNFSLAGFKPWLGSGGVLFYLFLMAKWSFNGDLVTASAVDWLTIFYPGRVLFYLTDAAYIPLGRFDEFYTYGFTNLLFYGQSWWVKPGIGIGLIIGNYVLWTYWLWQGLKRRFHNPHNTIISKEQSYWFTGWFVAISLGFTLQTTKVGPWLDSSRNLLGNFIWLECFLLVMFLGLIAALSPHRQTLHDWARYRHQLGKDGNNLWKELVFGEKSPSTVAIAINIAIVIVYILPSLFLFPLKDNLSTIFWNLLISANVILIYALIAQLILSMKSQKRAIWALTSILLLIILPFVGLALVDVFLVDVFELASVDGGLQNFSLVWLFTFLPTVALEYVSLSTVMIAIFGQWLAIALLSFQMTKQLNQAGASETKILLSSNYGGKVV